jgi:hypothetical protein
MVAVVDETPVYDLNGLSVDVLLLTDSDIFNCQICRSSHLLSESAKGKGKKENANGGKCWFQHRL